MKTEKEIESEIRSLYYEADKIDEFLMSDVLGDEHLKGSLSEREKILRSKAFGLLWVLGEGDNDKI